MCRDNSFITAPVYMIALYDFNLGMITNGIHQFFVNYLFTHNMADDQHKERENKSDQHSDRALTD